MLVAPSRLSVQLFASRVVLVQSNWKSNGGKSFHDLSHQQNKKSPFTPLAPLLSKGIAISSAIFSPLNVSKFGIRAMSSRRGFVKPERQRLYLSSPGQLIRPFLPPENFSLFSKKGLASVWGGVTNKIISLVSSQQIRTKLKKNSKETFYTRSFRTTAAKLYEDINKAIAEGDMGTLRSLLTEKMFSKMSKEVGLKERKGVNLSWEGKLDTPRVVCVRYTRLAAEKIEEFGQVTVYFSGQQTVNVNDVTGKVVSASSSPISEYWTFERHLQQFGSWRLCAKPTHATIDSMGW